MPNINITTAIVAVTVKFRPTVEIEIEIDDAQIQTRVAESSRADG